MITLNDLKMIAKIARITGIDRDQLGGAVWGNVELDVVCTHHVISFHKTLYELTYNLCGKCSPDFDDMWQVVEPELEPLNEEEFQRIYGIIQQTDNDVPNPKKYLPKSKYSKPILQAAFPIWKQQRSMIEWENNRRGVLIPQGIAPVTGDPMYPITKEGDNAQT